MKKNLLTIIAFTMSFGFYAQSDVILQLNHKLGDLDFAMNTVVAVDGGYDLKITRLQYYISEVELIHDGGQTTMVDEHFLVNANGTGELSLGQFDITNIEGVNFSIGVDKAHNHLDPSTYPMGHPLAPQNPSMHWGWTAGYRFVALEGKAGDNTAYTYEIHALGDDHYKTVQIITDAQVDGSTVTISLDANYLGMFKSIDVSAGAIVHGEFGIALTLLDNFQNNVFFPEGTTAVIDQSFEGAFSIQPNPSADGKTNALLNLPISGNYKVTVTDLTGRVIQTQQVTSGKQTVQLKGAETGVFLVHLWQDEQPVAFEKWVVTK